MLAFLILFAATLLAATLIPLSNSRHWSVRAFDFPRFQIACLSVVWLTLYGVSELPHSVILTSSAIAVLGLLVYQCYWILQYTQLHDVEMQHLTPDSDKTEAHIRILSCNVLMSNRNSDALLALVEKHQPDVLITLESDQWWQDRLDVLDSYPHRLACPRDNLYGMHVYSRQALKNTAINYLVEDDKPSMNMLVQLNDDTDVNLYVLHPAPPAPNENSESIERDVELLQVAKTVAGNASPVIVAGDLNDVAWSATTRLFRQISGLLDPRVGRGLYNTFNAHYWFLRWPLDHVFASPHFRLVELQRLPSIGSDHFPLLVELAVTHTKKTPSKIQPGNDEQELTDPELLERIFDTQTAKQSATPARPV